MKVIVDDKIPYIREALAQITRDVVYLPGGAITAQDVKDADALLVRTRTRCDESLLADSRVQFIATATIGFDHLDRDYLERRGITWCNCPGCNATSVGQYIHSVLLLLKRQQGLNLTHSTLGVVGVGHVGRVVAEIGQRLGMRVLLCDPPRAEQEGADGFVTMEQLADESDVLTFHTPLIRDGRHATYHLADEAFLQSLQRKPVLINSSRGEVVDNQALVKALDQGWVRQAVIDTWENEPHLSLELLDKVYIGTPHIAGYSADGKANATTMVLQALCRHFQLPEVGRVYPPSLPDDFQPESDAELLALQLYNPLIDSQQLRQHPERFEELRGNYPLRRENVHNF